ncbi:MAG: ketopantoate reductase family protein [Candidatus Hermodarchaeota archaeon]
MNKKTIRIGFIGAGSIGSLFGGYLANIKSDIYEMELFFFCMKEHAEAIGKEGLRVYKNQSVKEINNIKAYENEKLIEARLKKDEDFRFDYIFLTTKTYNMENAVIQYKKLIDVSDWLVILQNGIGNEDIISNYVSKMKIIRIVTSHGAFLESPGNLIHTGDGFTKIGFPYLEIISNNLSELEKADNNLAILKDLLESAGFETQIVKDIIKESWEKVFVNVGINAFGALTNLKNGQLLESEGLKHLMGVAVEEAVQVAKKKKIQVSDKDFVAEMYDVARKTSNNKNSMLQDILNGMATEIDFINGRVLRYAQKLGVKVPINELLTHLIKGLESSSI